MSSWGGICICGAGCKRESGCRGYGRQHEHEMEKTNTSATIISGIAPLMKETMGTEKKSCRAEEGPDCNCGPCNSC